MIRSIRELKNLKGKRIILRAGFDVPVENGKVLNFRRIKLVLPTIKFLSKRAPLIIISHQGRPKGKYVENLSLKPLVPILEKFLGKKIFFLDSCLGKEVEKKAKELKKGEILLLENVRFHQEEEKNDKKFAKKLAELADIYVNDAFPGSHREHASIVGIPKYLPGFIGFQFEEEIKNLSKIINKPKHPFLFILGGAKFETKIPLVQKYLKTADHIFIGGAMLNVFLNAEGFETGISLTTKDTSEVGKICRNKKIILPTRIIIKNEEGKWLEKGIDEMSKTDNQTDLTEDMIVLIEPYIKKAKLIVWNGPFNKYEDRIGNFTKKFLKLLLKSKAEVIIGGGDTLTTLTQLKMEDKFTFVSTGGGATLEFLAKGTLPGIKALE